MQESKMQSRNILCLNAHFSDSQHGALLILWSTTLLNRLLPVIGDDGSCKSQYLEGTRLATPKHPWASSKVLSLIAHALHPDVNYGSQWKKAF